MNVYLFLLVVHIFGLISRNLHLYLHLHYMTIHIFFFIHPILDELDINTSKLDDKPLDVIYLKNLSSKVSCALTYNNISMNLKKWGGRGKKIDSNSLCWTFKIRQVQKEN